MNINNLGRANAIYEEIRSLSHKLDFLKRRPADILIGLTIEVGSNSKKEIICLGSYTNDIIASNIISHTIELYEGQITGLQEEMKEL